MDEVTLNGTHTLTHTHNHPHTHTHNQSHTPALPPACAQRIEDIIRFVDSEVLGPGAGGQAGHDYDFMYVCKIMARDVARQVGVVVHGCDCVLANLLYACGSACTRICVSIHVRGCVWTPAME